MKTFIFNTLVTLIAQFYTIYKLYINGAKKFDYLMIVPIIIMYSMYVYENYKKISRK